MEADLKERLTSREVWMRGLYMVLFAIAYSIAELVVIVLVVFQFLVVLLTGAANENVLRLGNNLSAYVFQILQFQTFNSEDRPYPFSDWPDAPLGPNRWAEERPVSAPEEPPSGPGAAP